MSAARAKGTAAESAVVAYLREYFPHVERRAARGNLDAGDIAGIPGVVIEVKNHRTMDLDKWILEALAEARGGELAAVWHKRRMRSSPGDWYVTMTGAHYRDLLAERAMRARMEA